MMIRFLGDTHGDWHCVLASIEALKIGDTLIHVGDVGVGFSSDPQLDKFRLGIIADAAKEYGVEFLAIRGNHDDPSWFDGEPPKEHTVGVHLIRDYSVTKRDGIRILFVGGGRSIDRALRKGEGVDWWLDEVVTFLPDEDFDQLESCDILVTHTTVSRVPPTEKGLINAPSDPMMTAELRDERIYMDRLVEKVTPKLNVFGHFHDSRVHQIDGVEHRLLDINEHWDLPTDYFNEGKDS